MKSFAAKPKAKPPRPPKEKRTWAGMPNAASVSMSVATTTNALVRRVMTSCSDASYRIDGKNLPSNLGP